MENSQFNHKSYNHDKEDEQKITYYFSYFESFEEFNLQLFYHYHTFIQRVIIQLGQDWRIQSNLLWDEYHHQTQSEGYSNIFNIFLQAFLKDRINNQFKQDQRPENQQIQEYHQKVVKRFCRNKSPKITDQHGSDIGKTLTFKTLSLGFYVIATDIWCSIFKQQYENETLQKFQLKPLVKSIETKNQQSIVKKRKNSNNSTQSMRVGIQSLEILSYDDSMKSKSSQKKMKNLQNEHQIGSLNKRNHRVLEEENKSIIWKKLQQQDNLPPLIHNKIKSIFQKNMKCEKWQLISGFVINIFQVTYQTNSKINDVRIIKICREFYHAIVLLWMLLNTKKKYAMTFKEYQDYIKYILEDKWKPNYILALKNTYNIVVKQWNHIIKQSTVNLNEDFQVMKIFLLRIRASLFKQWSLKIMDINLQNFS